MSCHILGGIILLRRIKSSTFTELINKVILLHGSKTIIPLYCGDDRKQSDELHSSSRLSILTPAFTEDEDYMEKLFTGIILANSE